jgi:thiol:disulfide interchange protein DsbD
MAKPSRFLNIAWLLFLLFVTAFPALAQKVPVVTWSGALSRPTVRPGEKIAVRITANVSPGYHIYSLKPVKDGPQATEIKVAAKGFLPFGKPVESKPEIVNDPNFGLQIGMHEGAPIFSQILSVPKSAKPGNVPVSASVFFMACTDRACLPPKEVTVSVPAIKVEAGSARKEFLAAAGESVDGGQGAAGSAADSSRRYRCHLFRSR